MSEWSYYGPWVVAMALTVIVIVFFIICIIGFSGAMK